MEENTFAARGNKNNNTETVSGLILHTWAQAMCQPEGTSSISSWPVCVCVWERAGERKTRRRKVDDGCLLLLTSWWIATGLGKCLVQRMSGVRTAVASFTVTQFKQRCTHISIQMHHHKLSLSLDVIIIHFNFEPQEFLTTMTYLKIYLQNILLVQSHDFDTFTGNSWNVIFKDYLSWVRINMMTW